MAKKRSEILKVAGVTFLNDWFGGSREEFIKKLDIGEVVILERDYSNKHDDYAVKILTEDRNQIGYVPSSHSKKVAMSLEENDVTAKIHGRYSFINESNNRIYGAEIEVSNLLSVNEAKELAKKEGCASVILLFSALIVLLNIMF